MTELTNQFKNLGVGELRDAFLAAADAGEGNTFFNSFEYALKLFKNNYSSTINFGIDLLSRCRAIDLEAYSTIHKGSAYYWLGMAAFLIHDYQTAVFFFDAAVSEDLRRGHNPINNSSPALRFIQVQGEEREQAAQILVVDTQKRIERFIAVYNSIEGRPDEIGDLDIEILRAKFLTPSVTEGNERLRSLATTFISFFLEWDYRNTYLDLRVVPGTAEPFFIHLFKGCVLFESILKANPSEPPPEECRTLYRVLQHLHSNLGIPHDNPMGEADFPSIASQVVETDLNIHNSILFTGRVRNSVGHDLGWDAPMSKEQYQKLFTMIAISNLHGIASLY